MRVINPKMENEKLQLVRQVTETLKQSDAFVIIAINDKQDFQNIIFPGSHTDLTLLGALDMLKGIIVNNRLAGAARQVPPGSAIT